VPPDTVPTVETVSAASRMPEVTRLGTSRRQGRRRRYRGPLDIGFGLLVAVAALQLAPGLAIVGVVALLLLTVCIGSLGVERRRSRRR
jgi:hypothetical protein